MNVSCFTNDDRDMPWVPMPIDTEEEVPELQIKIPPILELFEAWKSCLKPEFQETLMQHILEAPADTSAMQQFFKPEFVDMMKLARHCAKYVLGWRGVTDDAGKVVSFKRSFFVEDVLPQYATWLLSELMTRAATREARLQAEKKI